MANEGTLFESLNLEELREHPNRLSPGQRIALVRGDQRRAWATGQRVTVEDLLKRYPALAGDSEAIIDLAYSEYMLRTEGGDKVDPEEYSRRFPLQAGALRRQLALHLALQQMTFTSVDTISKKDGNPSETLQGGPPVFASLPATPQLTLVSQVAQAFQTLMQGHASIGDSTPTLTPTPDGDVAVPGYEILSELGRGGMGVVYKARQHRLDRLVALKMILSGEFASKNDRERFREEAVKLARVQHQNIVQIYEVSEHDSRPYFAMEYLDGGSLAKEIAAQPLTPRIAARLILSLANAMQAAHEKGIVHRDLKPGNILLTASGLHEASERGLSLHMSVTSKNDLERGPIAKITDFGLAKGMHGEESRTVSGAILGTPSYMAPEQARGQSKSVGPPADIYALGAILYECLTGRPPFLAPNAIDTIYLVVHEEPVKPSAWAPKLPQDLETICLKCLEKLPDKRYLSAKALAEDLEAFLDNRPIKARPVGPVERLIKWAKRRPAQAALVGTLASAAVILLGLSAWVSEQRRQNLNEQIRLTDVANTATEAAKKDRDEKEKERLRAEGLKELAVANEKTAKEEEQKAKNAAIAEKLAKDSETKAKYAALKSYEEEKKAKQREEVAKNDALTAKSETEKMFGYAREAVNSYFTAVSQETLLDEPGMEGLRKTLLEQASKFYTKFAEERKNDPSVRRELAAALGRLGKIRAAIDLRPEGIALYLQSLDVYKKLDAENPGDPDVAASMAATLFELGALYRETKREPEAVDYGQQAVDRWDALACKQPTNEKYESELARSLNGLGGTYAEFKHYERARAPLDRALSIRKMLADAHPESEVLLRDLAVTYDTIATAATLRDEFRAAEAAHKEAVAIGEKLVKTNPERTLYRDDLARYYLNLGILYQSNGDPKLAADAIGQAADNWDELAKSHSKVKQFRFGAAKANRVLAETLFRLAQSNDQTDRESKAKNALDKARRLLAALLEEDPDNLEYAADSAQVDFADGNQLRDRRQFADAAGAYRRSADKLAVLLKNHDDVQYKRALANALMQLGVCLPKINEPQTQSARSAEAIQSLVRSAGLWKQLVGDDPQNVRYRRFAVDCVTELARLKLEANDPKAALAATDDGVEFGEPLRSDPKFGPREKSSLRDLFWRRALALNALDRFDDAIAAWDETLKFEKDKEKSVFLIYRLASQACTAKSSDAVESAMAIRKNFPRSGYVLYELARVSALAARTVGGDPADSASAAGKRAAEAVQILSDSRKLSSISDPQVRASLASDRDWDSLLTNKDWDALRRRDDFKKLLSEIKAGRTP